MVFFFGLLDLLDLPDRGINRRRRHNRFRQWRNRHGFRFQAWFFQCGRKFTDQSRGAASQLTVNPSSINFGSVSVGNSQTQSVTLANSGGPKLTITQATLSGTGFTLSGLSYPVTLAGGQSVTCDVTFTPQSPGTNSGSVTMIHHSWQKPQRFHGHQVHCCDLASVGYRCTLRPAHGQPDQPRLR